MRGKPDDSEQKGQGKPWEGSHRLERMLLKKAARPGESRGNLPPPDSPSTPLLVRYLSRALPESLALAVEQSLTSYPAARQALREVRAHLNALSLRVPAEIEGEAAGEGLRAEVAREWLAILFERAEARPVVQTWWETHGWRALQEELAQGVSLAQTAWAELLRFAEQVKVDMRVPRVAPARGAPLPEWRLTDLPPDLAALFPKGLGLMVETAEIDARGALLVQVVLTEMPRAPAHALEGRRITLALSYASEVWPLESAAIAEGRVLWVLSGFGKGLQLPSGDFPLDYLQIVMSEGGAASA
jgi:hypothetical protein